MYSRLFRQETARRLRTMGPLIMDVYLKGRMSWLNNYMRPDAGQLQRLLDTLADATASNQPDRYYTYAEEAIGQLLGQGVPPVAILESSHLFEDSIRRCLTQDQATLVAPILIEAMGRRRLILHHRVINVPEAHVG